MEKKGAALTINEERFTGCLLGAAIGDALGAGRVGATREELKGEPCDFGPALNVPVFSIPIGSLGETATGARLKPGQWTDDTQLSIGMAQALIDEGGIFVPEAWAHQLVRWANGSLRGPGLSTLQAALQLRTGGVLWDEASDPEGAGCGAATRVAPLALRYGQASAARHKFAVLQAQVTHGSPDAHAGALAVAEAIALALESPPDGPLFQNGAAFLALIRDRVAAASPAYAEFARCLNLAQTLFEDAVAPETAIRILGASAWVREAVPSALYCVAKSGSDPEALLCAAVTWTGDATDSIGSIVGAIGGALHGCEALPIRWREGVERGKELISLAQSLYRFASV